MHHFLGRLAPFAPYLVSFLTLGVVGLSAQQAPRYEAIIDVRQVTQDRLPVTVFVPKIDRDEVTWIFPATIPGTYESQRWWRFVSDFRAIGKDGKQLEVRRSTDSQFVISGARNLQAVTYLVDDSFDERDPDRDLFPPGGTSFEADSVFVFNHAGIIGYIEGIQKADFQVKVTRPKELYGASALGIARLNDTVDVYHVQSYDQLIDNPVMWSRPDTASFTVAGATVSVALIHPGKDSWAKAYAKDLERTTKAIGRFLPRMPVGRYAFLLYLWGGDTTTIHPRRQLYGALEHSYCSFYVMPATPTPRGLSDIASHEFLHILMPLNLHSEEIESFDFRSPKMSKHLWLYEGVTEYFAHLALLRDSAISEEDFFREFQGKIHGSASIPEKFSLTTFSKNVLTPENQELYGNIYTYGALNALFLDVVLRESSKGQMGLLELIYDLMLSYGPSKPFKDDELFDEIEKRTNSAVRAYLDTHVEGDRRLPMADMFAKIGMSFRQIDTIKAWTYGFTAKFGAQGMELFPEGHNGFDIVEGDKLRKIDGVSIMIAKEDAWRKLMDPKKAESITITVDRQGQEVELKATARYTDKQVRNSLRPDPQASAEAMALRHAVLRGTRSN